MKKTKHVAKGIKKKLDPQHQLKARKARKRYTRARTAFL